MVRYQPFHSSRGLDQLVHANHCALCIAAKNALSESSRNTSGTEKLKQIQKLAEEKLHKIPEARLSFSIGDKEIVVREVVQKTISMVTAFKDIIGSAISAEPCAGLAWAGIMSILPVRYPPTFFRSYFMLTYLHNEWPCITSGHLDFSPKFKKYIT